MSALESSRQELRIAYGLILMTPSPRGWEAFQTPRALTHIRITWAFSPSAPQVLCVTPGSPLCPWFFGHPFGEVRDMPCVSMMPLTWYPCSWIRVNTGRFWLRLLDWRRQSGQDLILLVLSVACHAKKDRSLKPRHAHNVSSPKQKPVVPAKDSTKGASNHYPSS